MKHLRKQFIIAVILMAAIAFLLPTNAHAQTSSSSAQQQTSSTFAKENPSKPACGAYIIPEVLAFNSRTVTFRIVWGCAGNASPHMIWIYYGDGNYDNSYCIFCDAGSVTFTHTYSNYNWWYTVNAYLNNELEPFYDYTIASYQRAVLS